MKLVDVFEELIQTAIIRTRVAGIRTGSGSDDGVVEGVNHKRPFIRDAAIPQNRHVRYDDLKRSLGVPRPVNQVLIDDVFFTAFCPGIVSGL